MAFFRYKIGREIKGLTDQSLQALCSYEWPGNVRELMNVIERAILLCKNDEISMNELPNVFHGKHSISEAILPGMKVDGTEWLSKTLPEVQREVLDQVERLYLEMALTKTQGRVDQTAHIAGIHPRGLYNKMKRFGLNKESFKKQQQLLKNRRLH